MTQGFLPDAINEDAIILIKACLYLRLTHEVRCAAFAASQSGKYLWIIIPAGGTVAPALRSYASEFGIVISRHTQ